MVERFPVLGVRNECWAIVPTTSSFSGSLATAFTGSVPLLNHYDRLLIASGTVTPPHIMGETSATLSASAYRYIRKVDE